MTQWKRQQNQIGLYKIKNLCTEDKLNIKFNSIFLNEDKLFVHKRVYKRHIQEL